MNKLYWLSIILFLSLGGCSKQDDLVFLRNKGADMPITIKGNKASNVFILYLHGGPGNGTYVWQPFFSQIEKKYAMVYWDQRAAGESQGNARPSTMNLQQFVDDTHQVVTLINKLYNHPKIFIMGHSWGGLLGTAYLIQHTEGIAGWIEVDGAHNKVLGEKLARESVLHYAQTQIDAGVNVNYWTEAINWYNNYTGPLYFSTKHYTEYLDKANAYWYQKRHTYYSIEDFFFGHPNGFDLLYAGKYSDDELEKEITTIDLTPQMNKITIPSMFCWGRHDGTIPYPMAQDAFDAVGTPNDKKSIVYFEASAHAPMIEEQEAFNQAVIDFVDRNL